MSEEKKQFNHYPEQFEIWFPYNGLRYKDWYDIKLHDGTVHEIMYPNGNAWSGKDGRFEDEQVAEVRLVSNERHPMTRDLSKISTEYRVKHSYDLFRDWIPEAPNPSKMFDFEDFLKRKWEFSIKTFGPEYPIESVLAHLEKEVIEVKEKPKDLLEWVDIINLAVDGAMRAGHTPTDLIKALEKKFDLMQKRTWPDWRTVEAGKPIEHVRSASEMTVILAKSNQHRFSEGETKRIFEAFTDSDIEADPVYLENRTNFLLIQIRDDEVDKVTNIVDNIRIGLGFRIEKGNWVEVHKMIEANDGKF